MKLVLDRFEEGLAVCEDMDTRETLTYPAGALPEDASPGDVLRCDGEAFAIDREETEARRERIKKMFDALWD